jgi:hypothetical protein
VILAFDKRSGRRSQGSGGPPVGGGDSDGSGKPGLWTPTWFRPPFARSADPDRHGRCAGARSARVSPGSGLALEGRGFYVWDEEPDRAREWARELTSVQFAKPASSTAMPGSGPPKGI